MACTRTTIVWVFWLLALVLAMRPVVAAASASDSGGPQWPNVPLPAPEKDSPGQDSFQARWPDISDDVVESIGAQKPSWPAAFAQGRPAPMFEEPSEPSSFQGELGLRYWFSWAKTAKDLYNTAGSSMVSRLTYDGMNGHAAEAFGRIDHSSGFYTKGYLGGALMFNGQLKDEDFPPVVSPYSSTLSDQKGGSLGYANVDLGLNLYRGSDVRVGTYVGYHYFNERVNAYGCRQTASNSGICGTTPVSNSILVITQDNSWHSLRVGGDIDVKLGDRLTLRADAAYLPYVKMSGTDWHHLRIGTAGGDFTGGIPEDGTGKGYQLEASLAYAYDENVSLAIGGRYWHMESSGNTHFEGRIVGGGGSPQPVNWTTDTLGVFVQGSFKFGPYATSAF